MTVVHCDLCDVALDAMVPQAAKVTRDVLSPSRVVHEPCEFEVQVQVRVQGARVKGPDLCRDCLASVIREAFPREVISR